VKGRGREREREKERDGDEKSQVLSILPMLGASRDRAMGMGERRACDVFLIKFVAFSLSSIPVIGF
jgi:hypothetical protein